MSAERQQNIPRSQLLKIFAVPLFMFGFGFALVPLYDIPLEFRVPEKIAAAYLTPGAQALEMAESDGVVSVVVPKVECHQAVVFEY